MASFNRNDYQQVYKFAKMVYFENESATRVPTPLQKEAAKIMDLCEMVIGQQSDRPERNP